MKKTLSLLKFMVVAGLIYGMCFAIGAGLTSYINSLAATHPETTEDGIPVVEEDGERTSILVLGIDARPGEDHSRSDTMMLVTIDPEIDKAAIISIPRDTRVDIKDTSLDKICAANYVGGPEYSMQVVEELMGLNIDYYVELDFKGFEKIIDTLGGVTINVPRRMYKPLEGINLYPGTQKLDGKQALAYVRYRDYEFGDIERTAHQQEFLTALAGEVLQAKTVAKLPAIAKELQKYIKTDLSLTDMVKMATWAPGFSADGIITQTLPGYFYDEYDEEGQLAQSYWIADTTVMADLVENMFEGNTLAVIQASPFPSLPAVKEPEQDEEQLNQERSSLPSPGHEPASEANESESEPAEVNASESEANEPESELADVDTSEVYI